MPYIEHLPSGRYRGVFRVPGTGRKVTKSFDYEYEAEAWAADAERRAARAIHPDQPDRVPAPVLAPSTPTVVEHGRELIERRTGRLADATVRNYRTHLAGLVHSGIGVHELGQLRRSDVERWITAQVKAGDGKSTINARLKLLRMIVLDARAERVVDHDPAAGVDYLTLDLSADRVLTRTEEAALLLAADAPLGAAALTALDAGLRWSEVYGLAADAVSGPYLVVRQVVERTTRRIRHYPKGHRQRVVPMTVKLAELLVPLADQTRRAGGHDALLFTSHIGGPMSYESWRRRRWNPAVKAARLLPPPGFHALRHTYGSRLADEGVPRSEIAKLMGHADEATTARYIHAGDDGRRLQLVRDALEGRRAQASTS